MRRVEGFPRSPVHSRWRFTEPEVFGWIMIIAASLGLDTAAVYDAVSDRNTAWAVIILAIAVLKLGLYGKLTWDWSRWV